MRQNIWIRSNNLYLQFTVFILSIFYRLKFSTRTLYLQTSVYFFLFLFFSSKGLVDAIINLVNSCFAAHSTMSPQLLTIHRQSLLTLRNLCTSTTLRAKFTAKRIKPSISSFLWMGLVVRVQQYEFIQIHTPYIFRIRLHLNYLVSRRVYKTPYLYEYMYSTCLIRVLLILICACSRLH